MYWINKITYMSLFNGCEKNTYAVLKKKYISIFCLVVKSKNVVSCCFVLINRKFLY